MDALESGSDVMVFSDNVPVEQEVALKRYAATRDLLVMGPDCGTAVVDGLGLGFANVVSPGPVGIVAASGTGCQQVLALLDHAGVGVTTAYGVGGRDLSAEVGGLATRTALARLDRDPRVELIVLISKPPADEVARELTAYTASLRTPVQLALLGSGRPDLTAATEEVLRALGREVPAWPVRGATRAATGARLHGLFVGGTMKQEAGLLVEAAGLGDRAELVDFGDDEYTTGRAHPMIDPSLRLERLARGGGRRDDRRGADGRRTRARRRGGPRGIARPGHRGHRATRRGHRRRHRPRPPRPRPAGRGPRRRRCRGTPVQRGRDATGPGDPGGGSMSEGR